jgi:hypothetical protein
MAFNKKLITNVDDLRADLKGATDELNAALLETPLYKKMLAFVLDEGIPDKKAKSYALKVTLDFYKSKAEQ